VFLKHRPPAKIVFQTPESPTQATVKRGTNFNAICFATLLQNDATCFATLLQNELTGDVALFTSTFEPVLQQIRLQ